MYFGSVEFFTTHSCIAFNLIVFIIISDLGFPIFYSFEFANLSVDNNSITHSSPLLPPRFPPNTITWAVCYKENGGVGVTVVAT